MTDKELRRSSRKDLIEMLYYLKKELDDAHAENERLNKRFDLLLSEASPGKAAGADEDTVPDTAEEEAVTAQEPEKDGKS